MVKYEYNKILRRFSGLGLNIFELNILKFVSTSNCMVEFFTWKKTNSSPFEFEKHKTFVWLIHIFFFLIWKYYLFRRMWFWYLWCVQILIKIYKILYIYSKVLGYNVWCIYVVRFIWMNVYNTRCEGDGCILPTCYMSVSIISENRCFFEFSGKIAVKFEKKFLFYMTENLNKKRRK